MEFADAVAVALHFSSNAPKSTVDILLAREATQILYARIVELRLKKLGELHESH